MTAHATVSLEPIEASGLASLVGQYSDLLSSGDATDPAVQRLAPDAYPDDREASQEFRRLTEGDLTARRVSDAGVVAAALAEAEAAGEVPLEVRLTADEADAWLRTLAGLRLVVAARLGIEHDDDHDPDDPRFGVYDWLGYRLELLVQSLGSA